MTVTIARMSVSPASRPQNVELLISDNPDSIDAAKVWITARFDFSDETNNYGAFVQNAIHELQRLVEEARKAAALAP